jgi:K+/H+ antiporter YhaU regulatory subunit KhtT
MSQDNIDRQSICSSDDYNEQIDDLLDEIVLLKKENKKLKKLIKKIASKQKEEINDLKFKHREEILDLKTKITIDNNSFQTNYWKNLYENEKRK